MILHITSGENTMFFLENCTNSNTCKNIENFFSKIEVSFSQWFPETCFTIFFLYNCFIKRRILGWATKIRKFQSSRPWCNVFTIGVWIFTISERNVPLVSHPLHGAKSFSKRTNSRLSKYNPRALKWNQMNRRVIFRLRNYINLSHQQFFIRIRTVTFFTWWLVLG